MSPTRSGSLVGNKGCNDETETSNLHVHGQQMLSMSSVVTRAAKCTCGHRQEPMKLRLGRSIRCQNKNMVSLVIQFAGIVSHFPILQTFWRPQLRDRCVFRVEENVSSRFSPSPSPRVFDRRFNDFGIHLGLTDLGSCIFTSWSSDTTISELSMSTILVLAEQRGKLRRPPPDSSEGSTILHGPRSSTSMAHVELQSGVGEFQPARLPGSHFSAPIASGWSSQCQ